MALVLKDRVVESSTSSGTGTFTLNGAETGYQSFSAIGNGNTTYYTIEHPQTGEWEVGVGTYNAGTLSRNTVLDSSNSGALVYFSSGQKNVFCDLPAEKVAPSDTLGTMAYQNANAVAVTGGTVNGTTIGATTASTGKFTSVTTPSVTATTNDLTLSAISTGNFNVNTPNGTAFKVLPVTATSSNWLQVGNPSTTVIRLGPAGTTVADFRILAPSFTNFYTGSSADGLSDGSNQMRVSHTASAVNYVQVTGSATGNDPVISAQGSDADRNLKLTPKGTGQVFSTSSFVAHSAAYNSTKFQGGASTGFAVQTLAQGSDTNISMAFQPKGTGAIDLAAGSSGVNISNGGTVTAVTRTASGGSYTSIPSVAITAPTSAGGVQATATATMFVGAVTIQSGGTGYTVNDVLTVVGGTNAGAATLTVNTVSAGVITAVTVTTGGTAYSVLPTNPVSVTGGTGSGATFNVTDWRVHPTFNITNAGSGYIEQPTVTFSGGGGSGASAYATVGGIPKVQTLGSAMSFYTPGGESFRIADVGTTTARYVQAFGASSSGNPALLASAGGLVLSSGASASVLFYTSSYTTQQMAVAHTASAVNYVQVTGGATGGRALVTSQGSDVTVPLGIYAKGGTSIYFSGNGGTTTAFQINHISSGANYISAAPAIAGSAPSFSCTGTDTNINLALTPKGTGTVQFGTYTAGILTPTGYITITDSGGTTRRLLVG